MDHVPITPISIDRFQEILDPKRFEGFARAMREAAECFQGRTLWSVNSTAKGGGVAEMLTSLLGYLAGLGFDVRWLVIDGDDDFFTLTKRLHNRLHGDEGDGGPLGEGERALYERSLAPDAEELGRRVGAGDIVLIHDPQPAGMVPKAAAGGAKVLWRCHIGVDEPNDLATAAWDFLRPYVQGADGCVFSRKAYAWSGLARVCVVAPSIDAFSPKNQDLAPDAVGAILRTAGIVEGRTDSARAAFARQDGSRGRVTRAANMTEDQPIPDGTPVVAQVSRWDRLKDPVGVLQGFAHGVPPETGAHLLLAGPWTDGVADDPESGEVFADVRTEWERLPDTERRRIHLARIPTEDDEENSAVVNAIQRGSRVVVQKSLAEGFGLTVAEAMWKERPVVASGVGGIQDQIVDGRSGVLVRDPSDLEAFGAAVTALLADSELARRMGRAARDRVCEEYLPVRHLLQYVRTFREGMG